MIDPRTSELHDQFANQYAELRKAKGVTIERAHEIMNDATYFGTMLVYNGMVDGMVSGAVHTTAHTVRPALEIIKTVPDVSTVSSIFLMCLPDRVLAYGDCAIIPNPTVEQLADIAISSARTAAQFWINPRVAMLSYSTGESGTEPTSNQSEPQPGGSLAETGPAGRRPHPIRRGSGPVGRGHQDEGLAGSRSRDGVDLPGPQYGQQHVQGGAAKRRRHRHRPGAAGLRKPVNDLSRCAGRGYRQYRCHHCDSGTGCSWIAAWSSSSTPDLRH